MTSASGISRVVETILTLREAEASGPVQVAKGNNGRRIVAPDFVDVPPGYVYCASCNTAKKESEYYVRVREDKPDILIHPCKECSRAAQVQRTIKKRLSRFK